MDSSLRLQPPNPLLRSGDYDLSSLRLRSVQPQRDSTKTPSFVPASKVIEKASRLRRSFNDDIFSGATISTDKFIADWNSSGFSVSGENRGMGGVVSGISLPCTPIVY
uniref:Uncharacterized protein n=1 Tax=Cannabis sativa TaxID=3483 RepID=A0A803NK84_CANSA